MDIIHNKRVSHFLWAPYSFIVLNRNLKFYISFFGKSYKPLYAQTTQRVGSVLPQTLRCITRTPAIIIFLLSYFEFFFVHFGCSIGGRIYYNMDHLYFCIYLFITRPQPQSSFPLPPLFACRMYCM